MSIYKCNECGMSVKTSCGECDSPLEDGLLNLDDGGQVRISQCKPKRILKDVRKKEMERRKPKND